MKKLDLLLVRSFIPPFILAFFIALFVLLMQALWLYIEAIIGKGVGMFLMMELIFYLALSLVPMALPIAILISSVLVFGNLSERYELSSMKSAGVSLYRVMQPLVIVSGIIAISSFYFSNNLIPLSNLKFKSRMYDIKRQKPTLSLEEGVFNDDFSGYTIRIGNKGKDGRRIEDVMIYDHQTSRSGQIQMIRAKRGEMYLTEDKKFFIMKLYDGVQYQDLAPQKGNVMPFLRSHFGEWEKVFDLSEFELDRTDEERLKTHYDMLSVRQLSLEADTIASRIAEYKHETVMDIMGVEDPDPADEQRSELETKLLLSSGDDQGKATARKINASTRKKLAIPQLDTVSTADVTSFGGLYDRQQRDLLFTRAISQVKNRKNIILRNITRIERDRVLLAKHIYTLHNKFALAVVCILFLFVGAPMGAIIRKGGFGYPMLISILFFMLFIIMVMGCREMMKVLTLNPVTAAWLPDLVFVPIGLLLTTKAMNDTKFLDFDRRLRAIRRLLRLDDKEELVAEEAERKD